jgi:ubiquinone/menaquinone biosynthesis C-methylase UbiE
LSGMPRKQREANFGNWIPRKTIIAPLVVSAAFCVAALPVGPVWLKILFIVPACVCLLFAAYIGLAYLLLNSQKGEIQKRFSHALLDRLEWNGRGKALDIGTGNGPVAILLAKRHPRALVTGLDRWGKRWDYSLASCEHNARLEGVADRMNFKPGGADHLPYGDGEFDAVTSNFVFHAVKTNNRTTLVREALRVLKQGGAFAFQDLFNREFYGDVDQFINHIKTWKLKKVEFVPTSSLFRIPLALRINHIAGHSGILFGTK